jgi:hypothetical protein
VQGDFAVRCDWFQLASAAADLFHSRAAGFVAPGEGGVFMAAEQTFPDKLQPGACWAAANIRQLTDLAAGLLCCCRTGVQGWPAMAGRRQQLLTGA